MPDYFIYYASINIVGAVFFGIMLLHDHTSIDKQEKQIKYDRALFAFLLYFISDAIWSGVDSGVFPVSTLSVMVTTFANFVFITIITYRWLLYVMAEEQIPGRNRLIIKQVLIFPLFVSVVAILIVYIAVPGLLITADFRSTRLFDIFICTIPNIYIIAVLVYTIRKAAKETNPLEKKKHLYIGGFPIMAIAGGLLQMTLMPELPIFCFSSTILMLIFYIKSMDSRISTDPLTNLNNRGQLLRYISQEGNLFTEGRSSFIVMIDINDFKKINDTYGHSEGDCALIILSGAITSVIRKYSMPIFLARYGGDEFILIVRPADDDDMDTLIADLRDSIVKMCEAEKKPYRISIGIGIDKIIRSEEDAFARSLKRADDKMYENKMCMKQA
ncbi:MAG: GGDEF domain-containing protein [Lachnospiraceae bacterium]|nr:GGDEF domain-containing protein [Lachnospiraceae bacterium]